MSSITRDYCVVLTWLTVLGLSCLLSLCDILITTVLSAISV